jgi:GAF domain-containing protein
VRAAQARQAALYADITAVFCKPASLPAILNECVEAIVRHLDAAFARIWTLNPEQDVLELQASAGMYIRLDGSHSRIPVGALKIGLIAKEKTPHLTNNVPNDPRVSDKEWAKTQGFVSFAGYPLLVEDRLVGVLGMFARRPLAPDVLDALASIAHLIALSIERTRVEDALRANEARFRLSAEHALEETGRRLAAQSTVLTELTATEASGSVTFDEPAPRHPSRDGPHACRGAGERLGVRRGSLGHPLRGLVHRHVGPAHIGLVPAARLLSSLFRSARARASHCRVRRAR